MSPRQIRTGTSVDRDVKAIEQLLDVGVAVEIDVRVRMAVARQELLDAQRAGECAEPTSTTSPMPLRDQLHAAQDERAHQDLAELGVGLHERQQLLAIELDHFARLARRAPGQARGGPTAC